MRESVQKKKKEEDTKKVNNDMQLYVENAWTS